MQGIAEELADLKETVSIFGEIAKLAETLEEYEERQLVEEKDTRRRRSRQQRPKSVWVRPWLSKRSQYGVYTNLMK